MGALQPGAERNESRFDYGHRHFLAVYLSLLRISGFGKKFGFALDVLTVASWQILIPLGVMGIWQLMSTIRIYIVVAAVLFSIVLDLVSDRKEAAR